MLLALLATGDMKGDMKKLPLCHKTIGSVATAEQATLGATNGPIKQATS